MSNINVKYSPKIEYSGELKLSLVDKAGRVISSKVHNNGTGDLFRYLSMCICGYDVTASRPRKLDILYVLGESKTSLIKSALKIGLRDVRCIKNEDNNWCSVLRFTINRDQISNPPYEGGSLTFSLLGGQNGETAFANVENVDTSVVTQIVSGTTLYVEWTMTITNKSVTEA